MVSMTLMKKDGYPVFSGVLKLLRFRCLEGIPGRRNVLLLPNRSLLVYLVRRELFVMKLDHLASGDFATKRIEIV